MQTVLVVVAVVAALGVSAFAGAGADRPRVLCLYTGGTIGMNKTSSGYVPVPGFLESLMDAMPCFKAPEVPEFHILEYNPLLDSSNMMPANWLLVAADIERYYDEYDGFVVIHGTDTLSYTASALSFLLENVNKTVVVTGSQIPMVESFSDGTNNLLGAIMLAGTAGIPEVCVFFAELLLRGNRVQKFSAWDLAAFDAGDYPLLGKWGGSMTIYRDHVLPAPVEPFRMWHGVSADVVMLHIFPGITGDYTRKVLAAPARGCILLAYGTGNGPDMNQGFLDALREASQRGVVLIDTTQCHQGTVLLSHYATGSALAAAGCISADDITPEAAFTKLSWLLNRTELSTDDVKRLVQLNMRGELSATLYPPRPAPLPILRIVTIVAIAVGASLALVGVAFAVAMYRFRVAKAHLTFQPISGS